MIDTTRPGERVTRHQLARRELEAAIRNLFFDEDVIAAHILVWSALEVVTDVGKARNIGTLRDQMSSNMTESVRRQWKRIEHDHYNFMKHADRDPDRVIRLTPEMTVFALYVACSDYRRVFGDPSLAMAVFSAWYLRQNPDMGVGFDPEYLDAVSEAFSREPSAACEDARRLHGPALRHARAATGSPGPIVWGQADPETAS